MEWQIQEMKTKEGELLTKERRLKDQLKHGESDKLDALQTEVERVRKSCKEALEVGWKLPCSPQ